MCMEPEHGWWMIKNMDNRQQYLDIAAGQGEKVPSRIVAFPAQPLNYALIEQRLDEQTDYTSFSVS